jgi:hypothetical protein
VLDEPGCDEILVHRRKHRGSARRISIDHHFQPYGKAAGIELFVSARRRRPPQIEIENPRQLAGCRQCDQLAAVLESTMLDDAMEHFGLQPGNNVREMWRGQQTVEQSS